MNRSARVACARSGASPRRCSAAQVRGSVVLLSETSPQSDLPGGRTHTLFEACDIFRILASGNSACSGSADGGGGASRPVLALSSCSEAKVHTLRLGRRCRHRCGSWQGVMSPRQAAPCVAVFRERCSPLSTHGGGAQNGAATSCLTLSGRLHNGS